MNNESPSASLRVHVHDLEKTMQCNCDLDRWEPERSSGHSLACRIHKAAVKARIAAIARGKE